MMKRFILFTSLFSFVAIASFLLIVGLVANGATDPFYLRFTSSKQKSLILGTSRAAQGIHPDVVNQKCGVNIYNYSFTVAHSPYGPTYLNSIKNKLDPNSSNGLFIVAVDPWSVSSTSENPNDSASFRELDLLLAKMNFVNMKPNFEYLLRHYQGRYIDIFNEKETKTLLHKDGWLEVNVSMDSAAVERRTFAKIEMYEKNYLPKYKFSTLRMTYLKHTLKFLANHGDVYMVRLPVDPRMMEIENELMPKFNNKIKSLENLTNGYFDLTELNESLVYTDGNHLSKKSGVEVSKIITDLILTNNN